MSHKLDLGSVSTFIHLLLFFMYFYLFIYRRNLCIINIFLDFS